MLTTTLTLIGTVHRDSLGEERLGALLDRLAPDVVTLEMSPVSLGYRQQHGRLLLQRLERILDRLAVDPVDHERLAGHPTIVDIRSLLGLPFEYRGAAAYAARRGCPLILVDNGDIARHKLRQIEVELITLRNLRTLTSLPAVHAGDDLESYVAAQTLLAADAPLSLRRAYLEGRRGTEGIGPRDRAMAAAIREQLVKRPRHLVHIGGWVHLIDDPDGATLFSLLADQTPERCLLA